jgi:hypothetical protein
MNTISKRLTVLALLVAGCKVSSPVVPAGPDTYLVSSHIGGCVSCSAAVTGLQTANKFCAKMGKVAVVRNTSGYTNPFGYDTSNQLTFSCVDEGAKNEVGASLERCKSDLETPELYPIRQKVELFRNMTDGPPPFAIASNDTFPTDSERVVIGKWATIRDACLSSSYALLLPPPSANAMQSTIFQQDVSFGKEASARVGELILALYQQKLTYGEFAQKRYEIGRDASAAELAFRQSSLERDQQRQMQAQQLAQQEFAAHMNAWATYVQAVNARQPQTVNVHIVP